MNFDIEDGNDYYEIIRIVADDNYFLEDGLGDPHGLDWDIDFLRIITKIIDRSYGKYLETKLPGYSTIMLVGDFVFNATAYALVNGCEQVSIQEMLNTFKAWDYLPFFTRLNVIDKLFEEQDLSTKTHPFKAKQKAKTRTCNVIQFQKTNQNKSEQ